MKFKIECKQKNGTTFSKVIKAYNLKSAKMMLNAYKNEFYNCTDFKLIKIEDNQ